MKYQIQTVLILIFFLIILVGCSGQGHNHSPIEPNLPDTTGITGTLDGSGGNHTLLGFWDVQYNFETDKFDIIPLRLAGFHLNAIGWFQEPGSLGITVIAGDFSHGRFDLDVTFTHPFPDSIFTGFDVWGEIIGFLESKADPDLLESKADPDLMWCRPGSTRLLNPDGWTHWWNMLEFTDEGLFGYTKGNFGSNIVNSFSTLNPYKYFANALSATDPVIPNVNVWNRGTFATNKGPVTRRYELQFPVSGGFPIVKFQYAINACWAAPTGGGEVPGIDDFPSNANCPEPFHVIADTSDSTAFFLTEELYGGDVVIDLEVFDWGAEDNPDGIDGEIASIRIESATLFDEVLDIPVESQPGSTDISGVYHIVVPDVHPTEFSGQEVLVWILTDGTYQPPFGSSDYPETKPLATFAMVEIPVVAFEPKLVGIYDTTNVAVDVVVDSQISYTLDSTDGLVMHYVADPTVEVPLNSVPLSNPASSIDYQDGYAYIADESGKLVIVDVEPYESAFITKSVTLDGEATAVDVDGDFAYVTDVTNKLSIVNISVPESASVEASVPIAGAGPITDVAYHNGYAYVTDDLEIFDVDPPGSASSVIVIPTTATAVAVAVSNNGYAYVADSDGLLQIVDISPPESASIVQTYDAVEGPIVDVSCDDNFAFAIVEGYGLKIVYYQESNNTAHEAGKLEIEVPEQYSINVDGNMAYISYNGEVDIVELWKEDPIPTDGWANNWGSLDDDYGHAVAIDGWGNIYVAGFFRGTVDFDPGGDVVEYTSNGNPDVFLSKFNPTGKFQWTRTWGGTETDEAYGVTVDVAGNIYVTGKYWGTEVDFNPGSGEDLHTSKQWDIFLSKFDAYGNHHWARTWGGDEWDEGKGVALDDTGIYVTGYFQKTADFDPGVYPDDHTSNGMNDVFLSKFDYNGDFVWAKTWGHIEGDNGNGVAADGSGDVYVTGSFYNEVNFDPSGGTDNHTSHGGADAFLSKFDSNGNFIWAETWGSTGGDIGCSVAVNAAGGIFIAGEFYGTVDFDPGAGTENHGSVGGGDVFLSSFESTGTFNWARTWGGSNWDHGYSVAAYGSDVVYVTGDYKGNVEFDPGAGVDKHSPGGSFLSCYLTTGDFQWARTWGGFDTQSGRGVATDLFGDIYVTGDFYGSSVDFNPGPGTSGLSSNGGSDSFLVKLLPNGYWY